MNKRWLYLVGLLAMGVSPPALADPSHGATIFSQVCSTCHGSDAGGKLGVGLNLKESSFVRHSSDQDLIHFLEVGREGRRRLARRRSDNELVETTCGFDMPPKGGASTLTRADLADVVAYLRTITK
ncbi:MAG TPA: c-type cytochrome [Candidatus Xenobia bacterium]|jgi:mono/diheme cytochrome c family protein